jgi:hypothetical protein
LAKKLSTEDNPIEEVNFEQVKNYFVKTFDPKREEND